MTTAPSKSHARFGATLEGLKSLGLNLDTLPKRMSTTNATRLRRIERLTEILDTAFEVPGTKVRVGLDTLIGLLPVAGDTATALVSFYIVYEARKMGISRAATVKMLANIGIDSLVGMVPLAGDLFDLAFKANVRNLKVIRAELEKTGRQGNVVEGTVE
jgi:hypothetical protein